MASRNLRSSSSLHPLGTVCASPEIVRTVTLLWLSVSGEGAHEAGQVSTRCDAHNVVCLVVLAPYTKRGWKWWQAAHEQLAQLLYMALMVEHAIRWVRCSYDASIADGTPCKQRMPKIGQEPVAGAYQHLPASGAPFESVVCCIYGLACVNIMIFLE